MGNARLSVPIIGAAVDGVLASIVGGLGSGARRMGCQQSRRLFYR